MEYIDWNDFEKVQLRVGTIKMAEEFPEARRPAWIVYVDLGELVWANWSGRIGLKV